MLFIYRHVLRIEIGAIEQVPRARLLVVALLYGSGLRLQECLELRVKDLDFDRHEIVVRRGKGQKDRRTKPPRVSAFVRDAPA